MIEAEIITRLRKRYDAPVWAFIPQVRNQTGFGRRVRTIDAIAMSLYPSRGLELMAFEIKTTRQDWVRELKDPEKADEIAKYCDRWWIVAPEGVVEAGELPPTWGLLIVHGTKIRIKMDAPKLNPPPISREFLAAICRRVTEEKPGEAEITAEVNRQIFEYRREEEELDRAKLKRETERATEHLTRELNETKSTIKNFEDSSGVKIDRWDSGNVGAAIRFLREHGEAGIANRRRSLEDVCNQAKALASACENALASAKRDIECVSLNVANMTVPK